MESLSRLIRREWLRAARRGQSPYFCTYTSCDIDEREGRDAPDWRRGFQRASLIVPDYSRFNEPHLSANEEKFFYFCSSCYSLYIIIIIMAFTRLEKKYGKYSEKKIVIWFTPVEAPLSSNHRLSWTIWYTQSQSCAQQSPRSFIGFEFLFSLLWALQN